MFADTDAVRAFGSANAAHAADLESVATALLTLPDDAMLGPVGVRFLAAYTHATAEASRAVSALADRLAAAHRTALAAAAAYDDADGRSATLVSRVY